MNLELTGEEVAFREEMRKFFTTEFSPELRARAAGFGKLTREDIVAGQQILNAHGWRFHTGRSNGGVARTGLRFSATSIPRKCSWRRYPTRCRST